MISFPKGERAFLHKYLGAELGRVPKGSYESGEAPGRAFLESAHKCVADFVPIHARLGICPEARVLIEEFAPGLHQ